MCGIAGIYRADGSLTRHDVEAVLRMLDAQMHRGPDDWGILLPDNLLQRDELKSLFTVRGLDHVSSYKSRSTCPAVILGSRRLSILDLSIRGRMPLSSATGATWVTHNGEIYNSPALRDELQTAGFAFRSTSDTEVLVNGYDCWGDDFLSHLRGMFAFGLFDSASSRLVLARDRFGIKPLYYTQISDFGFPNSDSKSEIRNSQSEIFLFASEVRAIERSNLLAVEPEPEAAIRFLQLGSIPAPLTTVKNVFALPAGHMMTIGPHATKIRRYWSLADFQKKHDQRPGKSSDEGNAISTTRRLLDESVQQHLLSDAPLGIFLSGGVDSSALVALAASFRNESLTTLSIVFDEPEYDEGKYARLIADKYQTSHCETLLTNQELVSQLPKVFAAMDQPTVDGVNSFFVSRAAKQAGLKVVLSGLGGDEVFLGYDHLHKAHSLSAARRLFSTVPAALRKGLVQLAIPAGTAAGRSGLEKLAYLEDPSSANMYLMFRGLFVPEQIQKLLGLSDGEMKRYGAAPGTVNGSGARSLLDSFVINEFEHYLQDQLLKDTDCMSMAHSVETRVPFLDHKLVEHAFGLPARTKLDRGMNKPLLIKALGDDLPREIWDRPKMGFTFPFASWLGASRDAYQTDQSSSGIFDKREVAKVWTGFRENRFHWSRPWALVVLEQFAITS
jgi:asparagine synthase (glutamine-hydrolysing)